MAKKNGKGTESDDAFLKRIAKISEEELKKSKAGLETHSKEMQEYVQRGKETGKILEELEECEKISAEFKTDPPVLVTRHINGVSVEYRYEDKYRGKVGLLKKHLVPFLSATKDTSIFTPNVKAHGRAYVKRGIQKIPLPEDSGPPSVSEGMGSRALDPKNLGLTLKDGDIIVTEKDSYVHVKDIISDDDHCREMYVFPNSEACVRLTEKVTHPAPGFMDPSGVPEAIRKNSERTVMSYNVLGFLLVRGIFRVGLLDRNKNANRILEFPSECPRIEFLHPSKTYESIMDKQYAKLAKIPNAAQLVAKYEARKATARVCDEISAHIEVRDDNSIVIFGMVNSVKSRNNGKTASVALPDAANKEPVLSGKITVTGDGIYSDKSGNADPRVKAIIRYGFAIGQYTALLASKKELEQRLRDATEKKSRLKIPESEAARKEKERRRQELLDEQNYLKTAGDNEMADAVQMQIDEVDGPKEAPIDEEAIRRTLAWCDKELARLEPDINTNFPAYNPLGATDAA